MKKLLGMALLITAAFTACEKRDGEVSKDLAGNIMQSKTWRMTGYYDDGVDRLSSFSGYAFTFSPNGEVHAVRDGVNHTGTWSSTTVRSIADSAEVEGFQFSFGNERPVVELNKNWEVVEKTTKQVHLRIQDVADGPLDDVILRINY